MAQGTHLPLPLGKLAPSPPTPRAPLDLRRDRNLDMDFEGHQGGRGTGKRQEQRNRDMRKESVGGAGFLTRQAGRGEARAPISFLGHSGAAFCWAGTV